MDTLRDILNEIGDFKMKIDGKELSFPGVLTQEESDALLHKKWPATFSCWPEKFYIFSLSS